MSLKAKLKSKEAVDEENARLREEVAALRQKNSEHEKKRTKHQDEVKELQALVAALQKDNKGLKEEIGELVFGSKAMKEVKKKAATEKGKGKK